MKDIKVYVYFSKLKKNIMLKVITQGIHLFANNYLDKNIELIGRHLDWKKSYTNHYSLS